MKRLRLLAIACLTMAGPADALAALVCTTETQGNQDLHGVSGSGDDNVVTVGRRGSIYRNDGTGWSAMPSGTNEHLYDVEVVDAVTAFAVGDGGTVLQLAGGLWIDHSGFSNEDFFGVWAASAAEAYAVGNNGTIYVYDGLVWTDQAAAAGTNNRDLEDAWGDANSFYAMSDRGDLYRYDRINGTWDPRDTSCNVGNNFEDLWGDAAGNLFLARRDEVYRYDGAACMLVTSTGERLAGIDGSTVTGEIYAGGRNGTVAYFDGASWQESTETSRTTCQDAPPQVVADWHLDECTLGIAGSSVADSGPNGLTGTTVGGLDVENSGQLCAAAAFDGSTSYVSVPDSAQTDITDGISVAVWVRHNIALLKNWEAIVAKGDSAYRLHLNGGCGIADTLPGNVQYGFTFGLNGGCGSADLNSNVVPVPGVWYHVALTYDRSVMRIYIDGVLVNSASYSAAIGTNNFDLFIGENSQQTNRHWDGDIDELTIWDGAISAADVAGHMNRTRPCTNCANVSLVINHDNYGIHCAAETIQVDVVDSLTAVPRTDYNEQVTLDTSGLPPAAAPCCTAPAADWHFRKPLPKRPSTPIFRWLSISSTPMA